MRPTLLDPPDRLETGRELLTKLRPLSPAEREVWLLDQRIRPDHVAMIGDSAGGGLAVTTILRAREQGLPLPAATSLTNCISRFRRSGVYRALTKFA